MQKTEACSKLYKSVTGTSLFSTAHPKEPQTYYIKKSEVAKKQGYNRNYISLSCNLSLCIIFRMLSLGTTKGTKAKGP